MTDIITRIYPRRIKQEFTKLFKYSRINVKDNFLGLFFLISMGFSVIISYLINFSFGSKFILTTILCFFVIQISLYFIIYLKAEANGRFAESILPDALHLMSSNLRAGLTIDKALLLSARPEFGILSEEINSVGKSLTLGGDVAESLLGMSKNIKSDILNKTIMLIVSGLKSGGGLVNLLEHVSKNLRQRMLLEEKMKTSILMYFIFIFAAISFGAPILFGFSSFLINILETNIATLELPSNSAIPISFSKLSLSSSFVIKFSVISLITMCVLGSLILGLINKGDERSGAKYIPALIFLSLSVFFLARFLVKSLLGGLFGLG